MNRSSYAVPAMFCLAAALVTAQAPADRPGNDAPAAQQPAAPAQPPAAQQPATRPTPPASAQQPTKPTETSTSAANKVTYVGCVKPGTTDGTWILENAEIAPMAGAPSASTATPGAGAAVGTSGMSKLTLNLDPAATVNLKPHANHKVEVVGMVSPSKAGAEAAPSSAATTAPRQQFSVESFKMVSATCP